ncbi:unnamed protein product [Mytilus edulis]|uniref:Uncharacterized protein n=1 Tax=Mytilus edulis TaxID=6550 RepID=A0A8S3VG48_MYTED|nr:unnamed protein product [Mytilus edulis]
MEEKPSTSGGIKRFIPQELQDEMDEIVSKRSTSNRYSYIMLQTNCDYTLKLKFRVEKIKTILFSTAAKPADLDENQKKWLVVGICLHSVISQALRSYVVPILTKLCYKLSVNHRLETQTFPTHLQKHPLTNKASLNYEAVNNNKVKHGNYKQRYDYKIKSVVDLSKLFLQTHMAHYTGFDDTCDSSALLGLIINIDQFDPVVKSVAMM